MPGPSHYQLPLAAGFGNDVDKVTLRRVLEQLDRFNYQEINAVAPADLTRQGGEVGRPVAYLCDSDEVYWTKRKAQTGLASELIANRLAFKLNVGPATAIVRIDPFLATVGSSTRAVGTRNLTDVVSSKELRSGAPRRQTITSLDPVSRTRVAVFQSWIDLVDEQVLVHRDGRVFTHDHGDSFRALLPGPPRMVVAEIAGQGLNWSANKGSALDMASEIESLSAVEILEAVSGIPDEDGWQGMFPRRFGIARWLMKRQPQLRGEVIKWSTTAA